MPNAYEADDSRITEADSGKRSDTIALAVHTSEGDSTAVDLGEYCQDTANEASYNLIIDKNGDSCRSNDDDYAPWAAGPTGNDKCWHVCVTGYADWARADWLARLDQLDVLGDAIAATADHYGIPIARIDGDQLAAGERGLVGHADISAAWAESDHYDPGPDFPWDYVLDRARGGHDDDMQEDDDMTDKERAQLAEIWDQLRGPDGAGWQQLGQTDDGDNRTLVDAVAAIIEHLEL